MTGMDYWLARTCGINLLGIQIAIAIASAFSIDGLQEDAGLDVLDHPLICLQALFFFVLYTLHNMHALLFRHVSGIAYVYLTWVPNIVVGVGMSIYFMLAQLPDKTL